MPTPIRPVNPDNREHQNTEMHRPSNQYDGPIPGSAYAFDDPSVAKSNFRNATEEQTKLLYHIWENGNKATVEAQVQMGIDEEKIVYSLPSNVGLAKVRDLQNSGLVEDLGNNTVRFTKAGKMALSKEIFAQPSTMEAKTASVKQASVADALIEAAKTNPHIKKSMEALTISREVGWGEEARAARSSALQHAREALSYAAKHDRDTYDAVNEYYKHIKDELSDFIVGLKSDEEE